MILRSSVAQLHHRHRCNPPSCVVPRKCSSENSRITFPISPYTLSLRWGSRLVVHRQVSGKFPDRIDQDEPPNTSPISPQRLESKTSFVDILNKAKLVLPLVILASPILALVYPPPFKWFTRRSYAPALGFLMFVVGLNSREKYFIKAVNRPTAFFAGYIGQFVQKPLIGYIFATLVLTMCGFPPSLAAGIMLTSCVSGAQLANYATFVMDPTMAPLNIVMTSLSTVIAVAITPLVATLLVGERMHVDVKGMVYDILKIAVSPFAAGLLFNRFLPRICSAIRPFLPTLSVVVISLCVGGPLATDVVDFALLPFGLQFLWVFTGLHLSAFVLASVFLLALFSTIHQISNNFKEHYLT